MSRTAERLTRILSMIPYVIANPGATVDDVCERFGYTRNQLISDLDLVFVCGLPGYGPGDLMVAYVEDDEVVVDMAEYFSRPLRLNPAEGLGLLAAGMAMVSAGQAPPALERAVTKLSAILLPDTEDALTVELGAAPQIVDLLRRAARDGRVVDLVYTSLAADATTERSVEPLSVFSSMGNWYLAAYCRRAQDERVFRIDRVRSASPTDEMFEPPAERPAPEVRYTPSPDDVHADIRLGDRARWVGDYYPVEHLDDDGLIRFSASDANVIARLLLRLGAEAELVAGPAVSEALAQLRSTILARYEAPAV